MPYFSFYDREHRPLGMGSMERRVINYFRPRYKTAFKTESRGEALQSAANQFMAKEGINKDQRALIIHFIKKHFRPVATTSDPAKPAVASKAPEGQMKLTFESVLMSELLDF